MTEKETAELVRRAEQGDADAQFDLGSMYSSGQGVAQDFKEAVRWFRLVAEQGDAEAQNELGSMYYQGKGVSEDSREALRWYRLAAKQGYAEARNNAAWLYATSEEPDLRDVEKALEYAKLAVADEPIPSRLDTLAEAYLVNGLFQEAIEAIERAISVEPGETHYRKQLKRFEKAASEAKASDS